MSVLTGHPCLFSLLMPRLLFFPDFFLRFFLPDGASQTFFSLPMPRLLFFPDFFLGFFLPGGASQTFFLFPCPVYCSSWIFSPLPMDIRAMVLPDGCPHFHKAPTDPAHTVQQVVTLFTEGKPLFIKRIFRFDLRIKLSDIFIHIVKIGGVRHILCQTPPAYSLFHYALISICTTLHAGSSTVRSPSSVIR